MGIRKCPRVFTALNVLRYILLIDVPLYSLRTAPFLSRDAICRFVFLIHRIIGKRSSCTNFLHFFSFE